MTDFKMNKCLLLLLFLNFYRVKCKCQNGQLSPEEWSSYCSSDYLSGGRNQIQLVCNSSTLFSRGTNALQLSLIFKTSDDFSSPSSLPCLSMVAAIVQLTDNSRGRTQQVPPGIYEDLRLDIFQQLQLVVAFNSPSAVAELNYDHNCLEGLKAKLTPPFNFTACVSSVKLSSNAPTIEELFNDRTGADIFTKIDAIWGKKFNFQFRQLNTTLQPQIRIENSVISVLARRNIQSLQLSGSPLRSFAISIPGNIPSLMDLDMSNCQLDSLEPSVIRAVPNLESFNVSRNNLKELPAILSSLTQLRVLDVSSNGRMYFNPHLLDRMDNLRQLDLSSNILTNVSIAFSQKDQMELRQLRYLNLRNTTRHYMYADFINRFPELQTLILSYNENFNDHFAELFGNLTISNVRHFYHSFCLLNGELDLNPLLHRFPRIQTMDFARNYVTSLKPIAISRNANVFLNLSRNEIRQWHEPKFITTAGTNLTLDLSFNAITQVNAAMMNDFSGVHFVSLKRNPLNETTKAFHDWLRQHPSLTDMVSVGVPPPPITSDAIIRQQTFALTIACYALLRF